MTKWLICVVLAASGIVTAGYFDGTSSARCSECTVTKLLTADTSNGPVTGHVAPNTSCVLEYLGVPYAKPPVGELRFAAPRPIEEKRPYVAANYGFDCPLTPPKSANYPGLTPQAPRILSYFAAAAGTPQSEDCLTLNIWSKATPKAASSKKPVLVFFYGGQFTFGTTDTPFYNGAHLADAQDLVVVTVNYRTNIFGFPGAPGEPQNLGLRDLRAAVEWVRTNIGHFGGDAHRIILAGQSSGAVAVDYWAYAYEHDPIAAGLILASGTALSFPLPAPDIPAQHWAAVVAAVGCNTTTTTSSSIMTCMRAANWTALRAAAATVPSTPSDTLLRAIPPFYPSPDATLVFADYAARTAAGRFARVPVLAGANANEAGYYRIPAYGRGVVPTQAQVDAFHQRSFACPVARQARARGGEGVPAWVWRYEADWKDTRLYEGSGAYHGVDMHMGFGNAEEVSGLPMEEAQRGLVRVVQRAWGAFASDSWEGLGREMGWPSWGGGKESVVVLGRNNSAVPGLEDPPVCDDA